MARHHNAAVIGSVLCTASLAAYGAAVAVSEPVSLTIRSNVTMLDQLKAGLGAQLDALTSQRFTEVLKAHHVHLMTYRELIAKQGLPAMRRPAG